VVHKATTCTYKFQLHMWNRNGCRSRKPFKQGQSYSHCYNISSKDESNYLIDNLLPYVPLKNILLIRRRHQGWKNLGLCSAPRAFEQREREIFTCCDTGPWVFFFSVLSEWPLHLIASYDWRLVLTWILTGPHSVASYDTQGNAEDLFLPGSSLVKDGSVKWRST
jgi:hypothetical protein